MPPLFRHTAPGWGQSPSRRFHWGNMDKSAIEAAAEQLQYWHGECNKARVAHPTNRARSRCLRTCYLTPMTSSNSTLTSRNEAIAKKTRRWAGQ